MRYSRSTYRTATLVAALLIGATPGLASNSAQAGEYLQEDPVTTSESGDRQPRDDEAREVADTTTNTSASATASASSSSSTSSSSKGNGDCVAESSASATARAGDEQKEDHDSARQVSRDGDCESRSSSKASARTGGSPSGKADEE